MVLGHFLGYFLAGNIPDNGAHEKFSTGFKGEVNGLNKYFLAIRPLKRVFQFFKGWMKFLILVDPVYTLL
jgi:hypothetical protein